jgi:hypothetical protein
MPRRRLAMGGGQLADEIAAEREDAVLGQPRSGPPRGLPKVVLEGFFIHLSRWRAARYIDTSAQASLQSGTFQAA